jgi:hypothetical protein
MSLLKTSFVARARAGNPGHERFIMFYDVKSNAELPQDYVVTVFEQYVDEQPITQRLRAPIQAAAQTFSKHVDRFNKLFKADESITARAITNGFEWEHESELPYARVTIDRN